MDLIEFLRARLDEDIHWARSATMEHGDSWRTENYDSEHDPKRDTARVIGSRDEPRWRLVAECWRYSATHIARWDPVRVLAEIEAKQFAMEYLSNNEDRSALTDPEGDMGKRANNEAGVLRRLAWPYHDHPDYDPEWIPSGFPGSLHTSPVRRHG